MPLPLCVRVDFEDTRSAQALHNDGWRQVEILETWRGPLDPIPQSHVWPMTADAAASLAPIACHWFEHSRLGPKEKEEWIRNADPDTSFMCDAGFVILRLGLDGTVIVDLIGVDPGCRGRGLASIMLREATWRWHNRKWLQAGTQETNIPAKKLYESLGMKIIRNQRTFEK